MSDSNKEMMIIIAKMVIISVIASVLLGVTYVPTQKQLKINYEEARKAALAEIMPEAFNFMEVYGDKIIDEEGNREILYYRATDAAGNIVGYAFFRQQAGSQSIIEVAGGVDTKFTTLTGIEIMGHGETPGLGAKIVEPVFKDQFRNVAMADLMLSKKGGAIDAITGATISSQAVVDGLNAQIADIKKAEG
ncbi:MAG: RnfABCDGE type electron transport complex subunit G [Methanosarcinaceae archaeon]|nr:RnfABCDGE type electron transport complex subunit G [Methanosarcinaceae archaeon]